MGIQNLWTLISIAGRQIDIETLQSKRLAIDASIWLVQFVKAMRDEEGKMIKNAHLLGVFRRVCKLLFHRIRPVFVFDGGTPLLKKKTIIARRNRRDHQATSLKQTAQRLFLNQMKQGIAAGKLSKKKKGAANGSTVSSFNLPAANAETLEPERSTPAAAEATIDLMSEEEEKDQEQEKEEEAEDSILYVDEETIEKWTERTGINTEAQDIGDLTALPPGLQKEFIERIKRENRKRSRASFIPLAGKPRDYSYAQITNFLRTSELNKKIEIAKKVACDAQDMGHRIMSDASRRYTLTHANQPQKEVSSPSSLRNKAKRIRLHSEEEVVETKKLPTISLQQHVALITKANEAPASKRIGDLEEEDDLKKAIKLSLKQEDKKTVIAPKKDTTFDAQGDGNVVVTFEKSVVESSQLFPSSMFKAEPSKKEVVEASDDEEEDDIAWESVEDESQTQAVGETKREQTVAPLEQNFNADIEAALKDTDDKPLPDRPPNEAVTDLVLSPDEDEIGPRKRAKLENPMDTLRTEDPVHRKEDALDTAIATAENLTQWAGGAMRRAIEEHRKSTGQSTPPPATQTPLELVSENTNEKNSEDEDISQSVFSPSEIEMSLNLEELQSEEKQIRQSLRQQQRDVEGVSEEMIAEVMQLLDLFGVPYIVSPMEAEAQCAALEDLGLVDGIITDDSDIFAFGGRRVYKNIFTDQRFVEAFYAEDLHKELGLKQQDIIALALLLGSDYTAGINGIGIVNATEIINAFPGIQGLKEFRAWVEEFDPVEEAKNASKNKNARQAQQEMHEADKLGPVDRFKYTHKNRRRNWEMPETFPNTQVIEAYIKPQVDRNSQSFTWSLLKLDELRRYCNQVFGWDRSKIDQSLLPVVQKASDQTVQTRVDQFFHAEYDDHIKYAKIRSKRLHHAVSSLSKAAPEATSASQIEEHDAEDNIELETKAEENRQVAEEDQEDTLGGFLV